MEINNLLDVLSRSGLCQWLMQNHGKVKEYWIYSTTKKMADVVTSQERCPGKPKSNWTELNKKDAAEWNDNGRLF